MKKNLVFVIVIALLFSFTACGTPEDTVEPIPAPDEETVQATPVPTPGEEEPTPEPEAPQLPQTDAEVVQAMLTNPQELFGEGRDEMAENQGGQFGSGVAEKRVNEERMELFSGDDGAYMPLNTRLRDFGSDNRPQQAILIKFQPENVNNLNFNFIGMGEFSISFEPDGVYFVNVTACEKMAFSDIVPNNFDFRPDALYSLLVAFDDQANLRCIVWEENNYQNQAYFDMSLYAGADDIYESNWKMNIGFDGGGQLNLYEYAVYTFDSLTENPPVAAPDNSDNGGDMPGWAVRIGDFDAMSDGIDGNVETTDLSIGGSPCTGYRLDALAAFANADVSSGAAIVFEDGSEEQVADPADAFIVFMRDGQYLGKPFLGYQDMVYETAVMEIRPN